MLPAEVKLLKPNPAGCWHCVPAMMHGLAVLCGPSTLFVNGVPAPGKSVSVTAEAGPVRANIAAVAPAAAHVSRSFMFMSRMGIPLFRPWPCAALQEADRKLTDSL